MGSPGGGLRTLGAFNKPASLGFFLLLILKVQSKATHTQTHAHVHVHTLQFLQHIFTSFPLQQVTLPPQVSYLFLRLLQECLTQLGDRVLFVVVHQLVERRELF